MTLKKTIRRILTKRTINSRVSFYFDKCVEAAKDYDNARYLKCFARYKKLSDLEFGISSEDAEKYAKSLDDETLTTFYKSPKMLSFSSFDRRMFLAYELEYDLRFNK